MANITVDEVRKAQRAEGPATIMAIGTANPANCVDQSTYPDFYFRITNSDHMTELKRKFQRMCDKSMIRKRYLHLTEEFLREHPNMCAFMAPSLDDRQDVVVPEIPKLAKEAAAKAIKEWGQPKSSITHLGAIDGHLREVGLTFHLLKDVPGLVSKNIEKCLDDAFRPLGISDWNSLFWAAHPGGPAILDQIEAKLELKEEKLRASRHVLAEYGNMSSACVLFILDEMRKKSAADGCATTGEGLDWGVLFGFGPGLTVETVVLHSVAL
ncbi:unnamed protein product [Linum tenue]|uniref:Chalcone/stilbene synthase C-terminal domain-containing protein n=1 Tax=Linum tenue TaxID=586396 RepID=A0AAV0LT51_9ROSI|nr:unnamed protein product [Linum tenue]